MLNPVASTVLVVSYVIFGIVICGLLGAVCVALLKLNARLDDFAQKLDPLLQKADTALTVTTETVESLGSRAEMVLAQGEAAVEIVQEKVDRTAHTVQQVVNAPVIKANSLLAGVTQGWATFTPTATYHTAKTKKRDAAYRCKSNRSGSKGKINGNEQK